MKKRLMIFCDAYLPGINGGGGMLAVKNLAERFCNRYEFFIVTRDCDSMTGGVPYVRIARNKWTERPEANVFYASPSHLKARKLKAVVDNVEPDAIYLNSVFGSVSARFLLARRLYRQHSIPLVIAPCGELSIPALAVRKARKRAFLLTGKLSGLFRNVIWKASSDVEKLEIERNFSTNASIIVVPEVPSETILPGFSIAQKPLKKSGFVRFVYFSRITPKKNLEFLLQLLRQLNEGDVALDVIGPTDEPAYLQKCLDLANRMPPNVNVYFHGGVKREKALEIIANTDFMVLPTKNENYGYVVIESLAAGCPVILSDQLPWASVEGNGAGWLIPLSDRKEWLEMLKKCTTMNGNEFSKMSLAAREFAMNYLMTQEQILVNQSMLDSVLDASPKNG